MDSIGRVISDAVLQANAQPGCEVRLTFATEAERVDANRRLLCAARLEVLPGAGNFMFHASSTDHQIEMQNGSCIVLMVEQPATTLSEEKKK